jgi:hypothetical protein
MANEDGSPRDGDGGRLASSFSAGVTIGDVLCAVLDIYVVTRGVSILLERKCLRAVKYIATDYMWNRTIVDPGGISLQY